MVNRVATFSSTERLISDNMRLQSSLNDTQVQLSTGLVSTTYTGIASETQRLLSLERNSNDLTAFNLNGKAASSNINISYNAVKSMLDLSNNFLSTLTQAQSGNFLDPAVTKNQSDILTQEMVGLLNTQNAGRYVFAGSKIDVPPVDLTGVPAQTSPSTADTSYYQGDNAVSSIQMSESLTVKYGVTANNPAFENLIRGLNLASNNPSDKNALAEASTLIQQGVYALGSIFSGLSTYAAAVQNQTQRNEEDLSTMSNVISDIKNVDIAAVTVQQKNYEAQIEASYASSVKLLNLKLTDYL